MSNTEKNITMPSRPTKAQQQQRKAMDKLFIQGIKVITKKYGFKSTSSNIFKVDKEFFFYAFLNLNNIALDQNYLEIFASFKVKPFKLDDLYWEIFNLEENKAQPLSFRANGSFIVQGPTLMERVSFSRNDLVPNEENIFEILETCMERINGVIDQFLSNYSIGNFNVNKFHFVGAANDKSLIEILLPILNGRYDEALENVYEKIKNGEKARYYTADGISIFDFIIDHCKRKIS